MGYSNPQLTAARGTSAGGLIVGAVCNRSPGLFKAAILRVGLQFSIWNNLTKLLLSMCAFDYNKYLIYHKASANILRLHQFVQKNPVIENILRK